MTATEKLDIIRAQGIWLPAGEYRLLIEAAKREKT